MNKRVTDIKTSFMSPKFILALRGSLSVALAFLIPFYLGLEQASTASITVMIIATAGDVSSSVMKGFIRVIGTLIGAIIGITLISLFPQDRLIYLFLLSIFVTMFLYIARAYRGDKTIFMLSAMTMMIVFDAGNVDDVFIYGVDRTLMSILGIVIYTIVSIYLFPLPVNNQKDVSKKQDFEFIWFDIEDLKGAFISFLIFWLSVYVWIEFNITEGFYIVVLATSLSLYTTYSVVKPHILIFLFTFSFIFAMFMYIFVLPNLFTWWHLALFLFFYSFIGFYFINPKINIFFLLGIATLLLDNEMSYNFAVFLTVLLIFYLFLFVLLFFDYIPFNQKSEYMFLKFKDRFFRYINRIEKSPNSISSKYLFEILKKMQFNASKIDYRYFNKIEKEKVLKYTTICEKYLKSILDKDVLKSKKIQTELKVLESSIDFNLLKESKF